MSRDTKGRFIKGNKHSVEIKEKIKIANTGKPRNSSTKFKKGCRPWNTGKKTPHMTGENNPNWKGGISSKDKLLRMSTEYKNWRKTIFERDSYTCQVCREVGVYLEAHHIKSWASFPDLRFDIENGITLCKECHSLTDNYKGRQKGSNI